LFKIDYKYKKGGPEYSKHYPSEEDANHNIFIIKGKNDRGKSTLMQMIALGLYGGESEDIDIYLKDRMQRLLSKDVEKCEFDFTIVSQDGGTNLRSRLVNGNIKVTVDGRPRGKDYIKDKFKILYDIPEEPIKKLAAALRQMEYKFSLYETYINNFVAQIRAEIERFEAFEDKESRLKELKEELEKNKKNRAKIKSRLDDVEETLDNLEKIKIIVEFEKAYADFETLTVQMKDLEKRKTDLRKAGVGGGTAKYNKLLKNFTLSLSALKILIDSTTKLNALIDAEEKKELAKISKEINSVFTPSDLENGRIKRWYDFFDTVRQKLESKPLYEKKLAEEDQIRLFKRMIKILKDFIDLDGTIPGTEGKTVIEFIKALEIDKKELENKVSEKLALNKGVDLCSEIIKSLGEVVTAKSQIPKTEATAEEDYYEISEQLEELRNKSVKIAGVLERLESKYRTMSGSEKKALLKGIDRDNVFKEFEDTKKEKKKLSGKVAAFDIKISNVKSLIEELKKTKKPDLKFTKDELKTLFDVSSSLIRKISSWRDQVSSLDLKKLEVSGEVDEDSKIFYEALGDYFASVLKVIYFENQGWELEKVDLLNHCYVVNGRPPIGFLDIGTGHTALNALLASLKQDYGGKKKVLLFDEIGHMDENNVNRLLNEIKKQVISGEVIFAFLTQMDNSLDDVVMEPIPCN
jgi:DNA repair exonuclease SbcCD ATPase subunit